MGSRNTFNLFYKSPSEKQHHNTIIPRALGKLGWLIEHQDARSPFGHPIEPMVFAHAKACEGTHCEALRRLGTRKTNEVDRRWHLAGLVYIYIVYVYSFILVAAIWRCHNFTGFVASAKTVLENHVHVLKQFEAAVALPSTGHVQVSVPWDTCSQPQGVSTLCRCVGLDRMINQLAIPFGSSLEWKKGPWDLDFCGAHFRMKAAVPETKIFRRAEWQHYIRRQGRVTITKITKCPTDDLRLILTVKCFVTLWSGIPSIPSARLSKPWHMSIWGMLNNGMT